MTAVLQPVGGTSDDATREVVPEGADTDPRGVVAALAMAWSGAAGIIHLLLTPSHLAEAWWLGAGFLVVGVAQLVLAALLARPRSPRLLLAGVAGTTTVVVAYVATRTVDLWFMPAHGPGHESDHLPVAGGIGNGIPVYPGQRIEPVGPLDLTCLVAELVVVAMLLALLPARTRSRTASCLATLAVAGAAAVLLLGA